MRKILYFESIGGASGDMILGSLIGLGVCINELNNELKSLNVDPFKILVDEVIENGITGVKTKVKVKENKNNHHGRHLSSIIHIINESNLENSVKEEAIKIFCCIGEAEAEIHGEDIEKIHFHEVGAMDSIIDIVGCCLAKNKLGIDNVFINNLPFGHGTINCEHGIFPNPAPATLRILNNFPTIPVDEPFELVTPTGAAILKVWNGEKILYNQINSLKTSYSFGQRKLSSRPNLLRATIYNYNKNYLSQEYEMIECNLDDTTPELIGLLTEKLLKAGALDVFTTSILMKKQRPGTLLSVLISKNDHQLITELIFKESTTFGIRFYEILRDILDRTITSITTEYGDIRIKIGKKNNTIMSASPEIEDCKKLANNHNIPVDMVYKTAISAWFNNKSEYE